MNWHTLEQSDIEKTLKTSARNGLSPDESSTRLDRYGLNEIETKKRRSALLMIADQFKDLFIIILLAAAVIACFVGDPIEAAAICAIVILNAGIGFVEEMRAQKAMNALKKMAAPTALVMRNGKRQSVPAPEIVAGDVVLVEAGNIVPADMRIIESSHLKADESALTGESQPVEKIKSSLSEESIPVSDRINMLFSGTIVTNGTGRGIVIATGSRTELGKIAGMIQGQKEERTPLQKRLDAFSKRLALIILIIVAIIFGTGLLRGESVVLMFLTAISLAVAAIPEALPAVVTISLALGARKMARQNALIRRLPAVETLGSVSFICTDKTGTLTRNEMHVQKIHAKGKTFDAGQFGPELVRENPSLKDLLTAMALSNDAHPDAQGTLAGDPTDVALCRAAVNAGYDKTECESSLQRVDDIPFDSDRKMMTTIHRNADGSYVSFTKGALESILERTACGDNKNDRERILSENNAFTDNGMRVIAIGMRSWDRLPDEVNSETIENSLVFLGIAGLIDPPRDEAGEAVQLCKQAGITPVMITGDHPGTAQAIARQLDIMDQCDRSLTGRDLAGLGADEFSGMVERVKAYARVAPEQKLNIVDALLKKNQFVAMTGDGVNDAPALQKAHIGVSMGITGTDVAKEASDMILLDDNFATLVHAVREGRRIFDNILKFLTYSLTSNTATIVLIFLAPFFGLPLPLMPIQILWINLLCDSLPGLALTSEPAHATIMQRPPRPFNEGVFAHGRGLFIICFGGIVGVAMMAFQAGAVHGQWHWQTALFTALILSRLAIALSGRSDTETVFTIGVLRNRFMITSILITFALQMLIVYMPAMNIVFKTQPLTLFELGVSSAFAGGVFVMLELWKKIRT